MCQGNPSDRVLSPAVPTCVTDSTARNTAKPHGSSTTSTSVTRKQTKSTAEHGNASVTATHRSIHCAKYVSRKVGTLPWRKSTTFSRSPKAVRTQGTILCRFVNLAIPRFTTKSVTGRGGQISTTPLCGQRPGLSCEKMPFSEG